MPISPQRQAANQANAQHSTGPRTARGKSRSARNAEAHGLACDPVRLNAAEKGRFYRFFHAIRDELKPRNEAEVALLRDHALAAIVLQRIRRIETGLLRQGDEPAAHAFVLRYLPRWSRRYFGALDALLRGRHQADRVARIARQVAQIHPTNPPDFST